MKKHLLTLLPVMLLTACGYSVIKDQETEAVYLGVENYGAEEVNKDTKEDFSYRFEIDGKEEILKVDSGAKNSEGEYEYPIQNQLKEGYSYDIMIEDGTVKSVEEKELLISYQLPVAAEPGGRTLKNFLSTALMPVGNTLYVYGGGWDWQDVGSAIQTRTIGVSKDWLRFFQSQDENYTYRDKDGDETKKDPANSYYPYGG